VHRAVVDPDSGLLPTVGCRDPRETPGLGPLRPTLGYAVDITTPFSVHYPTQGQVVHRAVVDPDSSLARGPADARAPAMVRTPEIVPPVQIMLFNLTCLI
jgi:hypothetical protein